MTYADFQANWERGSRAEYDAYLRRPPAELLADAQAGRHGSYYGLWRAIAARTTLSEAGPVLLEVLRGDYTYLVRYHAAEALLALLETTDFEPADVAAARPDQAASLDAVERLLHDRIDLEGSA